MSYIEIALKIPVPAVRFCPSAPLNQGVTGYSVAPDLFRTIYLRFHLSEFSYDFSQRSGPVASVAAKITAGLSVPYLLTGKSLPLSSYRIIDKTIPLK
jgi:hypothetical protein